MMRKNMYKFAFLAFLFYATESSAVLWPPCPICPSFDGVNDVIETAKALLKKARVVVDDLQYAQDKALNVIKTAKKYMALDFSESPLKKEVNFPVIATAKDIVPSEVANIADAASVSEGFQKLFLKDDPKLLESFPVDYRSFVKNQYEKKRAEFAYDNMIEVYVSARQLEDDRLSFIKGEVDSLSECFVEGREGLSASCEMASASDEELGNWVNGYKLQAMQDSMMRVYEELMAMEAQYQAGNSLREGVRPVNDDAGVGEEDTQTTSFYYNSSSPMGYAQQAGDFVAKVEGTRSAPKVNPNLTLVQTEEYKEKPPFAGSEELINSLAILNGTYELLSLAEEMHNTKQQLPDLRKPFIEYEKMRILHYVAIERLAQSEQFVRSYLSDYYESSNADDIWFGDSCRLGGNQIGYMCQKIMGCNNKNEYDDYVYHYITCPSGSFDVTAYEKKPIDSLSGESIREYQLAKAKKVMDLESVDTSDPDAAVDKYDKVMGKTEVNMDQSTETPDMDSDPDVKNYVKDSDTLSKPSNEAEAEGGTREQNLNRWQIGRQKSIEIGEDMQSGGKKFGFAKVKYKVWNDERHFYDQYLREKYRNMMIYFESGVLEEAIAAIAGEMNEAMTIDEEKLQKKVESETKSAVNSKVAAYAASLAADDPYRYAKIEAYRAQIYPNIKEATYNKVSQEFNEKLANIKAENRGKIADAAKKFAAKLEAMEKDSSLRDLKETQDKEMANLISSFKANIAALEKQKVTVNEEIEDETIKLDAKKAEYNRLADQKKSLESSIEMQKQSRDLAKAKKNEYPGMSYESGMQEKAENIISKKEQELEKVEAALKKALEGVEELQDTIDDLRKQVVALDQKIEDAREDYIAEAVEMENAHILTMKIALENRSASAISFEPVPGHATLMFAFGEGKNMVNIFREAGVKTIQNAYQGLLGMGYGLYDPDKFGQIKNIHIAMLDNLIKVAFMPAISKVDDLVISNASIISKAPEMLYKIIFKSDCEGAICKQEDKDYFVSLKGRARDFTVPKMITPKRTAPLREVFHFDYGDYGNLLTTGGKCSKKGKVKSLAKTTRHEFLETGQDMPAIWETILKPDGFIDRDVDIVDILNQNNVDDASRVFLEDKGEGGGLASYVSEMSVFLKYEGGLTFTNPLFELICYFHAAEDEASKKKIKEDEYKENELKMLGRDQIGDYLQFVDQERTYQLSMAKLKVKVDEGRRSIEDVLAKIDCSYKPKETGYITYGEAKTKIVSAEYIADKETFESIAKCLDDGKNMFLSEAQNLLKQLPEFKPVEEAPEYTNLINRKKKIENLLDILQTDFDELVLISDNLTKQEVEDKIKTKKADKDVVAKYEAEAQKEFENNKKKMAVPYRAKYF